MAERNFPGVAERMGLSTGRAANEGEFTRWLEAWVRQPAPALLECVMDAGAYNQQTELLR
jgi:thiamine pyrophosphate-dependent acetolactate synthase large subunit-like protein